MGSPRSRPGPPWVPAPRTTVSTRASGSRPVPRFPPGRTSRPAHPRFPLDVRRMPRPTTSASFSRAVSRATTTGAPPTLRATPQRHPRLNQAVLARRTGRSRLPDWAKVCAPAIRPPNTGTLAPRTHELHSVAAREFAKNLGLRRLDIQITVNKARLHDLVAGGRNNELPSVVDAKQDDRPSTVRSTRTTPRL
jgi:hypothetical protein